MIHIEADRYRGVPSYESWWDVPVAEVSEEETVRAAREAYDEATATSASIYAQRMSELLVSGASTPEPDGTILTVTPESAGWERVGFEVLVLSAGGTAERVCGPRELCIVVISGVVHVASEHGEWFDLGGRPDPWAGLPDAAYLPPESHVGLRAGEDGAEVALCWGPAHKGGAEPRVLPGRDDQGRDARSRRVSSASSARS